MCFVVEVERLQTFQLLHVIGSQVLYCQEVACRNF